MADRVWDKFLTERDKAVFQAAGYGTKAGPGRRPAVIVIDVNYNFTGDTREPILESIKRWPNSCGEEGWDAIAPLQRLIGRARAKGLPVIYTTGTRRADGWDRGSWDWKNTRTGLPTRTRETNRDGNDILQEIAPEARDVVIRKLKPSAFHGTPLQSFLTLLGVDTLIVTGTTTSGCVRASVLDAFANNFRIQIMEEGCFDRSQASHAINLCDMDAKYADVVNEAEIAAYIDSLPEGLFELPKGGFPVEY
ncbi:MAG: isochorismatase family protein [Alphaproteobacteria bacterium]|nr:isochorismatase family protein [Alphaproteobacteria bacterium]